MLDNVLEIDYSEDIITINLNFNTDILEAGLTKEVKDWLSQHKIKCHFQFNWAHANQETSVGNAELTFENEQDKLAFVLRWC